MNLQTELFFDGPDFDPELDRVRLTGQTKRIFDLMSDNQWRTLEQISVITRDPQASISAQLINLRKPRFGRHLVEKQRRGDPYLGLWEYRLTVNQLDDLEDIL